MVMRSCFEISQPVPTTSYVELSYLDAFDRTNYFFVSETPSKAVLANFPFCIRHRSDKSLSWYSGRQASSSTCVNLWFFVGAQDVAIAESNSCANLPLITVTRKCFPVTFVISSRKPALLSFQQVRFVSDWNLTHCHWVWKISRVALIDLYLLASRSF